ASIPWLPFSSSATTAARIAPTSNAAGASAVATAVADDWPRVSAASCVPDSDASSRRFGPDSTSALLAVRKGLTASAAGRVACALCVLTGAVARDEGTVDAFPDCWL